MSGSRKIPLSIEQRIDRLCDQLERSLRSGRKRQIEELLEEVPSESHPVALLWLLMVEIEFEWDGQDEVRESDFHSRFPDMTDVVASAFSWAREQLMTRAPASTARINEMTDGLGHDVELPMPHKIGRFDVTGVLGEGGFGRVYRAFDSQLNRAVAIKAAGAKLLRGNRSVEALLDEARASAALKHPGIVGIYEFEVNHDPPFIVQELIEGGDLRTWMKTHSSFGEIASVLSAVADAMGHAHECGLVHLDLKPGNILMDRDGMPHVADFGLAVHESSQDLHEGHATGTPAYMSPEQLRGETHRVDGRADIWAIGVILYEWLTGQRPFVSDSVEQLSKKILTFDPRPPSQRHPNIPVELERICLKCLQKRAADRYSSTTTLREDLVHWMEGTSDERRSVGQPANRQEDAIRIVPKGLRSFDEGDHAFFLRLLPGPRDREGIPDSVRFWKNRLEESDCDESFSVGLLYGPSGCGKSSFVKAGLLPELNDAIRHVYIECTAENTEACLLAALRKRNKNLDPSLGLAETVASLRQAESQDPHQKLVIIVDQFEQWLSANANDASDELVHALRQCDGGRVQCLIMVRDDFYLAVNRFFRKLEVPLLEGHNCALADLFDLDHAERVLALFGQAYGRLPVSSELSETQRTFLRESTKELAIDGKVICVRLALFAQMLKSRVWDPATLRQLGGISGVGENFLEETFVASTTAPLKHRYHQEAARSVLAALMPTEGREIKGHMLSQEDLVRESGYRQRPEDFRELIQILDSELRLISPIDPEQLPFDPADESDSPSESYYQLTHDYMVPSLREWLTRKQRETPKGRAKLKLESRTKQWVDANRDRSNLPGTLEWIRFLCLVPSGCRTQQQQAMIKAATNRQAVGFLGMVVVLMLVAAVTFIATRRPQTPFEVLANSSASREERIQAVLRVDATQLDKFVALANATSMQQDGNVLVAILESLRESVDRINKPQASDLLRSTALKLFQRQNLSGDRDLLAAQQFAISVLEQPGARWMDLALDRLALHHSTEMKEAIYRSLTTLGRTSREDEKEWLECMALVLLDVFPGRTEEVDEQTKTVLLNAMASHGIGQLETDVLDRLVAWCLKEMRIDDSGHRKALVHALDSTEPEKLLSAISASQLDEFANYVSITSPSRKQDLATETERQVSSQRGHHADVDLQFFTMLGVAAIFDGDGTKCDQSYAACRNVLTWWAGNESDFQDFQFADEFVRIVFDAYTVLQNHRDIPSDNSDITRFLADLARANQWDVDVRVAALPALLASEPTGDMTRSTCELLLENRSTELDLQRSALATLLDLHHRFPPMREDVNAYLIHCAESKSGVINNYLVGRLGSVLSAEDVDKLLQFDADDESKGLAILDLLKRYPDDMHRITESLMKYVLNSNSRDSYINNLVNLVYREQDTTSRHAFRQSLRTITTNTQDEQLVELCAETHQWISDNYGVAE